VSRAAPRAAFAAAFVSTLWASLASERGGLPEAEASVSCAPQCEQYFAACVKQATERAKVKSCLQCCKDTEERAIAMDGAPADADELASLEDLKFSRCVTDVESMMHPEWFWNGFPHTAREAAAYTPVAKPGSVAEALQKKYGKPAPPRPGEGPARVDASACTKGCAHRPQEAIARCTVGLTACRRACAPAGAGCPKS
jgi:hypothetical protein